MRKSYSRMNQAPHNGISPLATIKHRRVEALFVPCGLRTTTQRVIFSAPPVNGAGTHTCPSTSNRTPQSSQGGGGPAASHSVVRCRRRRPPQHQRGRREAEYKPTARGPGQRSPLYWPPCPLSDIHYWLAARHASREARAIICTGRRTHRCTRCGQRGPRDGGAVGCTPRRAG